MKSRNPGRLLAGVLVGIMSAGCGHARTVQTPDEVAATPDAGTEGHAKRPKTALTPESLKTSNGIELTTSPAGQLKPGAAKLIQQRLARAGLLAGDHETGELDGETLAALARFQEKHELPATGEPDRTTVKQLGLAPDAVFKVGAAP